MELKESSDEEPVNREIDSLATITEAKQAFKNINQKYNENKEPMITAEMPGNKEFKKDYYRQLKEQS